MLIESLRLLGYSGPAGDVDHVIHFLLHRLDPQACKQVCSGCWPIIEPQRDGRQFRLAATKVFLEWKERGRLKATVRKGILDERWGHGRVLGELVYELVAMAMRKECNDGPIGSFDELKLETDRLLAHIQTVKEETAQFLNEHPLIEPSRVTKDHSSLEKLNNALFDPVLLDTPKPVGIFTETTFDQLMYKLNNIMSAVPKVPDLRNIELQAKSMQSTLQQKHNQLAALHSQLDHLSITPKPECDWSIENESINLII